MKDLFFLLDTKFKLTMVNSKNTESRSKTIRKFRKMKVLRYEISEYRIKIVILNKKVMDLQARKRSVEQMKNTLEKPMRVD